MRGVHRIAQHANTRNAHLDRVARHEQANASGSSGGDDVAGKKSHHARNPANEISHGINHQRSVAGLAARAVHVRFHKNVGGVEIDFARLLIERREYAAADSVLRDAVRIGEHAGPNPFPAPLARKLLLELPTRDGNRPDTDSAASREDEFDQIV